MYCQHCGTQLPSGAAECPACGAHVVYGSVTPPSQDELDQIAAEVKRAVKDLASASAKLSQRLAVKAGDAAKDPSGSAKKAANRVAKELDKVAAEVDRILNEL